ncbi:MAG TPA: CPBP family intramembrane glutamic endopeptidase [Ktedonobacterales bacterium]|nr:CPBP family intramembrane glutamic endopeptidase [Ktedonobacterales bacterium]
MNINITPILFLLPSLISLIVLRTRRQPWGKICSLLGWRLGAPIHYLWALLIFLLTALLAVLITLLVVPDLDRHPPPGITVSPYAHLGLSLVSLGGAFLNEFFFTALGEEIFFRGWLGGWLMRRYGFLVGNTLQTLIFLLPHLAILLVEASLWPLLLLPLLGGWLNGWLRYRSESVLPGLLVHALLNTLSDGLAMAMG